MSKTSPVPFAWLPKTATALAVFAVLCDSRNHFVVNHLLLDCIRSSIYTALAGSIASVLGFVTTAAAILLTIDAQHLKWFAAGRVLKPMFETFTNTIVCMSIAFGLCFLCLALDRDPTTGMHKPNGCFLLSDVLLGCAVVAFAFLVQTVQILKNIGTSQLSQMQDSTRSEMLKAAEIQDNSSKF